jgi:hypothetical protein
MVSSSLLNAKSTGRSAQARVSGFGHGARREEGSFEEDRVGDPRAAGESDDDTTRKQREAIQPP